MSAAPLGLALLALVTGFACGRQARAPAEPSAPAAANAPAGPSAPAAVLPAPQIAYTASGKPAELREGARHQVHRVEVGPGAVLEVLDWGGSGPPVVLLAGLGNSAHIFDDLASALLDRWRVLGISRRGFGASSTPSTGYDVPTLGADILRVLARLELSRAFFVGHSVAGEELTWLGSEHAGRVLGLVYLDAAYDRVALREHRPPPTPEPPTTAADLASPASYAAYMSRGMGMPMPVDEVLASFDFAPDGRFVGLKPKLDVIVKIADAVRVPNYGQVRAPTLALYALADHWNEDYSAYTAREREKLGRALPSARIVVIPHGKHYLFLSHRAEVVQELRAFLAEPQGSALSVRQD